MLKDEGTSHSDAQSFVSFVFSPILLFPKLTMVDPTAFESLRYFAAVY